MGKIPHYRCIDAKTRNVQFFIKTVGRFSLKLASEKPSFYLFALIITVPLCFPGSAALRRTERLF